MPHLTLREPSENNWTSSSLFLIHTCTHKTEASSFRVLYSSLCYVLSVAKLCSALLQGNAVVLVARDWAVPQRSCTAPILSRFLGVSRSGYSADAENLPRRWWLLSAGPPGSASLWSCLTVLNHENAVSSVFSPSFSPCS